MENGTELPKSKSPSEFEDRQGGYRWEKQGVLAPEFVEFRENLSSFFIHPDQWRPEQAYIDKASEAHPRIAFVFSGNNLKSRGMFPFSSPKIPPLQELIRLPSEEYRDGPPGDFRWEYISGYDVKGPKKRTFVGRISIRRGARFYPKRVGDIIGADLVDLARRNNEEERLRVLKEVNIPYALTEVEFSPVYHVRYKDGKIQRLEEDDHQVTFQASFSDGRSLLANNIIPTRNLLDHFPNTVDRDQLLEHLLRMESVFNRLVKLPDPFNLPFGSRYGTGETLSRLYGSSTNLDSLNRPNAQS